MRHQMLEFLARLHLFRLGDLQQASHQVAADQTYLGLKKGSPSLSPTGLGSPLLRKRLLCYKYSRSTDALPRFLKLEDRFCGMIS
jgi:hypothetical protein